MASTVVDVYNLALSAIGNPRTISTIADRNRETEICNIHYETTRDVVLCAAPWSSAKKSARLALLVERDTSVDWTSTDPSPGWNFAYRAPADFLYPRFLHDYSPFELGLSGGYRAVETNLEAPVLTYTMQQTNVALWTPALFEAVANGLAARIAMPLMAKPGRAQLAFSLANQAIMNARMSEGNTDEFRVESMPAWLTARGASGPSTPNRFIYPNGPLLAFTNV